MAMVRNGKTLTTNSRMRHFFSLQLLANTILGWVRLNSVNRSLKLELRYWRTIELSDSASKVSIASSKQTSLGRSPL